MNAAKGDRPAVAAFRRHLAELVAIAPQVGHGNHFVLLVMMAENQQPRAHVGADGRDAPLQGFVVERLIVR
jgi:hypothetical protein